MLTHTVHDAIVMAATLRPGARAYLGAGVDVSYEQLASDALHASRFIAAHGLKADDRAALRMPNKYLHAVFILALDRLGVASVSHSITGSTGDMSLVRDLKLTHIFAADSKTGDVDVPWIEVDADAPPASLPVPPDYAAVEPHIDREASRITRFILTSGTTGTPKAVALSRHITMKRIIAHHLICEGMGSNRYLLGMPFSTIAGYGWLLMALCRGATAVPCLDPRSIVGFINAFQVSHLLLTPILFNSVIDISQRSGRELTSVCSTTTGGAPFDRRLVNRALAVFGRNIWNGYASTEAGSIARGHISQFAANPNMIGPVLPFVTLEIVDGDDNPLPVGETGIVRIASELTVARYENSDDEDKVFRKRFVYPGDLGSLDAQGRLRILGRVDELINLRGVKIMPEDIERPISTLPGIRGVAAFQADLGQGVQVCAALVLDDNQSIEDISHKVQELLGPRTPHRIQAVTELPRNAMGKIMRRELAKRLASPHS